MKKIVQYAEQGRYSSQVALPDDLPAVPVLPETLLRLDLEVQERGVDLQAISQLVLSDLGATVQVLRSAGREFDNAEAGPTRMADCISNLGLQACMEAVSAPILARDGHDHAIVETWAHAREIAYHAKLVAEEMPNVNPDEAYLAGLLHVIGLLPAVLGWDDSKIGVEDGMQAALKVAAMWLLPRFVVQFFCEMRLDGPAPSWPEIVREAHRRATMTSIHCPFQQDIHPQLLRGIPGTIRTIQSSEACAATLHPCGLSSHEKDSQATRK